MLQFRWEESIPSGKDIESLFLHELCESSENEYFLAVSDLFLRAVSRQHDQDKNYSLSILAGRILDAAEFARGIRDDALVAHFRNAIDGFAQVYFDAVGFSTPDPIVRELTNAYLAMRAIQVNDLPLARLILYSEREMTCTNSQCENHENEVQCPKCSEYLIPYVYHQRHHNCRNVLGHPPWKRNDKAAGG